MIFPLIPCKRSRRTGKRIFTVALLTQVAILTGWSNKALALDEIVWSGYYGGLHIGGIRDKQDESTFAAVGGAVLSALSHKDGSFIGGIQAGYHYVAPLGLVVGLEGSLSVIDVSHSWNVVEAAASASYRQKNGFAMDARGKIGYGFMRWMVYGTAGVSFANQKLIRTQVSGTTGTSNIAATEGTVEELKKFTPGWTVGAGLEYAFLPKLHLKAEYLRSDYSMKNFRFPRAEQLATSESGFNVIRFSVTYQFN